MPEVLNRHHLRGAWPYPSLYIGRQSTLSRSLLAEQRMALDGTALGNPYNAAKHGENALVLYKRWLWGKIQSKDLPVLRTLSCIRPNTSLICSCKPRPCHGDIVLAAWEWLRDHGGLET